MNREIKFRVWNFVAKIMYYPENAGDVFLWQKEGQVQELMQFTGLQDKNGVDIYEGDVYTMGDKNILYTVIWHDSGLIGKQNKSSSYAGIQHWREKITILGNIYEHPELLTP